MKYSELNEESRNSYDTAGSRGLELVSAVRTFMDGFWQELGIPKNKMVTLPGLHPVPVLCLYRRGGDGNIIPIGPNDISNKDLFTGSQTLTVLIGLALETPSNDPEVYLETVSFQWTEHGVTIMACDSAVHAGEQTVLFPELIRAYRRQFDKGVSIG